MPKPAPVEARYWRLDIMGKNAAWFGFMGYVLTRTRMLVSYSHVFDFDGHITIARIAAYSRVSASSKFRIAKQTAVMAACSPALSVSSRLLAPTLSSALEALSSFRYKLSCRS